MRLYPQGQDILVIRPLILSRMSELKTGAVADERRDQETV
jgi:hypothetical protein